MKHIVTISRILLGLIFVVFGLNGFLHFIPTHQFRGVAGQFIGAILTSHFLYRRISDSDRQWFALARKQIRPVGAASSRTGDRQHSWLSHFHVHNESPARACSHCALVDCVLPGAQCLLWCVCREGSVGGQTQPWETEWGIIAVRRLGWSNSDSERITGNPEVGALVRVEQRRHGRPTKRPDVQKAQRYRRCTPGKRTRLSDCPECPGVAPK